MPDGEQDFHGDIKINSYNVLRRLQHHSRADIPGMMAQRALSTFTLQQENQPDEASGTVAVMVYPQNPFVGEPEVRRMLRKEIQYGLKNSRIQIADTRGIVAKPDEEGDYLYWPGTPEFDQVNAFYYATFTLRMYERYAHRTLPWAFPNPRILIDPYVGSMANAFYNEQERMLGFHTFTTSQGETRSTAQSADIVTHETAHAILDGLRDLWNESFGLGPRAFHESFGDITAMLVALNDDALIHQLLKVTGGDLRMSNFVTEVAEHLTSELQDGDNDRHEDTIYLRNAVNMLTLRNFDELAYLSPDPETELTRQEHNFSRVFTGAIYDMLVGIYENMMTQGKPPFVALYRAGEIIGHLVVSAVEMGPVGELDFQDMARSLLAADQVVRKGRNHDIIKRVLDQRRLLSVAESDAYVQTLQTLPDIRLPDVINNALAAAIFLEEAVLPALGIEPEHELIPLNTYRNAVGQAFMTFYSTTSVRLEGPQYKEFSGAVVDLFGGLTLCFDGQDHLRSYFYRPVLPEDIQQVRQIVEELVAYNRIATRLYPPGEPAYAPEGLVVPATQPVLPDAKLVTYPAIVDPLPNPLRSFRQYLNQIRKSQT